MYKKLKVLSVLVTLANLVLPLIDGYIDSKQQEELIGEKLEKAFMERGL